MFGSLVSCKYIIRGGEKEKRKMTKEVKVFEAGNNFPNVGDYIEYIGEPYKVESLVNTIHTSRPGVGNYMYSTISPADWGDIEEGDIFPVTVEEV